MKTSLTVISNEALTMSSLEMVDYINADRKVKAESEGLKFPCKRYTKIQHKHILAKTPKVLGEEHSAKFLAEYTDSTGRDLPCYNYPKREACLIAMSYSYELQAQVFDHMTQLEGGQDINLLDFSQLTELTIQQMQDRVASAEKYSFEEHGQTGSALMTRRKKEKKVIKKAEQLVKDLIQFKLCDMGDFPDGAAA
ncbi:TPA: Rha family transcriptional regulator [Yersinia enterocolitica]|uniref:Rha family transcriptional regulator n=1 Tax=Yersinia mollaretii TaxID=33060 RepID=UPI000C147F15|nr:Rha family transcriptional regulator [Yersinia mollaretii]MDA5529137.1 Rha family transcriptional regulator [Yersinia mollaretii]PHZ29810.1 Rha family transcriptional regulator [Yersinia mollaretii]WQC73771.1 Rha family transcriptional regulator [Yersinia mollaretii]WQC74031.1 Rha family transcriptional regulator [Yersinia mollaretii]